MGKNSQERAIMRKRTRKHEVMITNGSTATTRSDKATRKYRYCFWFTFSALPPRLPPACQTSKTKVHGAKRQFSL
eukprot:1882066-Pyramimonas_sp.AAC.1